MNKYEIMVIAGNHLDASEAAKYCEEGVVGKIKEFGGIVSFEDFWGERGFAYMINKQKWGYYFVAQFELAGDKITGLRKDLNIEKNIVRFLITKVDKNQGAPQKYAEIKAANEALEKAGKEESEQKKNPAKREKLTTVKAAPVKKETAPKKDAVDKKLDAIVGDSVKDI